MKKLLTFLLTIMTVGSFAFTPIAASAEETVSATFQVAAKGAISVDFTTGKILYAQDADTPMGIASITKIITSYLVFREIKEDRLTWDEPVTVSERALQLSQDPQLSNVPLVAGASYTVRELLHATLIQSANAAATVLAERIATTESAFVDLMRQQLTAWGITDATVVNASGVNNEFLGNQIYPGSAPTDENLLSAKDVAIVARHLLQDFPEVLEITKINSEIFGANTTNPFEMTNWNWMLPGHANVKEGVDGLKTGTTLLAGECFVGTMVKDQQRIITVVLNVTPKADDPGVRFTETGKLMDYSYANWQQQEVLPAGHIIPGHETLAVPNGKVETVGLATQDPLTMWVPAHTNLETELVVTPDFSEISNATSLEAPIDKGQVVGSATVTLKNDPLGYLDTPPVFTTNIITTEAVAAEHDWLVKARDVFRNVGHFLQPVIEAIAQFFLSIGSFFKNLFSLII